VPQSPEAFITVPLVLALFGLGALLAVDRRPDPRSPMTLRERAIEAQELSARASQVARDLTARALAEE
jgi:hypothetical protein